jgi:hypothetical protein
MPEFKTLKNIFVQNPDTTGQNNTLIDFKESVIESVKIIRPISAGADQEKQNVEFSLYPWNAVASLRSPLISFSFSENMFTGPILGSMTCYDIRNWIDEFAIGDGDVCEIEIKFKIRPNSKEVKTVNFAIYNAQHVSDESQTDVLAPGNERLSVWRFDLMDKDFFYFKYIGQVGEIPDDRVMYVSNDSTNTDTPLLKGFVNEVYSKLTKNNKTTTVNIDDSPVGMWSRRINYTYPSMKYKTPNSALELLEYASKNNSSESNDYSPTFWWQDLTSWNFKYIKPSISDEEKEPVDGFLVTIDETNPNKILDLKVLTEYNLQKMYDNGFNTEFLQYETINPKKPVVSQSGSDYTESIQSLYSDFLEIVQGVTAPYSSFLGYTANALLTFDSHKIRDDIQEVPNDYEKYPIPKPKYDGGLPGIYSDNVYGYFTTALNEIPKQWEEYSVSNPKWLKTLYQPPYDITDLDPEILNIIHEKIRKPLIENRNRYAYLKNIKRKWEVFRCTVCCHENGALGSTKDIEIFTNPGEISGYTYNALFGATGLFADMDQSYKIAAAGSFTDLLNYDSGNTFLERGLTQSYDLSSYPYNQSIGQFFNLAGPNGPTGYVKFVIDRALSQYDIVLNKITERVADLQNFVSNRVTTYKTTADLIFQKALINKVSPIKRPINLLKTGIQGRYVGDAIVKEVVPEWPITSYEFGLIPASAIPVNKGFGQVVLGQEPNSNVSFTVGFKDTEQIVEPITFRNSTSNFLIGSDTFPVYSCCNNGTCTPLNNWNEYNECFSNGGVAIYRPLCENLCPSVGGGGEPGPTGYCCVSGQCSIKTLDACTTFGGIFYGDNQEACNTCFEVGSCCCQRGIGAGSPAFAVDSPTCPEDSVYVGPNIGFGGCTNIVCFGGGPGECCCESGPTGATGATGPSSLPTDQDVVYIDPALLRACSIDPIIRGYIKYVNAASSQYSPIYLYAAPYLWDVIPSDWSYLDYGTDSDLIPGVVNQDIVTETKNCLIAGQCYNTTCLSAVALEVLKRTCEAEIKLLSAEKELFTQLKTLVGDQFKEKWLTAYQEWYNRNSFFFSKKPGENIFKNEELNKETISSPLSLQNIKSIKRKEVRGSRYELLATARGITGASAGEWIYNIFFGGNSGSTAHPYYDQGYTKDSFITSRHVHKWVGFSDADSTDNPGGSGDFGEYGPEFKGEEYVEDAILHIAANDIQQISNIPSFDQLPYFGKAQADLELPNFTSPIQNTFRFYNTAQQNTTEQKTPPNIKKEEISSYVRIEFNNPIGLDRIREFPNGFIRDAGSEYFLPYLVQLTPGPFGRQGVKYNCAVIGIDPYGFDVAVKKIKDDLPTNRKLIGVDKGNLYKWWNHDIGSVLSKTDYLTTDYNGMDLWPEIGFETEYPYYSYDPTQEDMHGGGYDLDFHMGGAYYHEDNSQDWMESLYHYGMSSGKQFDPLYRTSVLGSYILPNSYRKLKPHRSWWSLFVPRNLFIPIRFANMFKSPNTKARDLFGGKAIFTISANYWKSWYGSEFENWIALSEDARSMLDEKAPGMSFFVEDSDRKSHISAYSSSVDGVVSYFRDSLMHYLSGSFMLYRQPGLVRVEDLWKYDLSGETEYGLVTPPVDTEYDFFDRNFAMQFVVYARGTRSCEDIGLKCMNPKAIKDGAIQSAGGCEYDPYCNCPALYAMPIEEEPTYLELYQAYQRTKECNYVKEFLGEDWLGCVWSNPDASCNCICPEIGPRFPEYKAYMETYATFWGARLDQPLVDLKSRLLLERQKIRITVPPNDKAKIGELVEVIIPNDIPETKHKFKRISGKWRVTGIDHIFRGQNTYYMEITLVRDGFENYEEYKPKLPEGVTKK